MNLLLESFNPGAVDGLMCRNLFSIGWDGRIFDCDFNQQLDLPLATSKKKGADEDKVVDKVADEKKKVVATRAGPGITVFDVDSLEAFQDTRITLGQHCYGCTAGSGSSCSGATS
uniref:Arsenosugar biosynthesis radical SAM protein ArsS-like C-terminal domain-containing protein n=1 Tax=Chloropicon laureae TaxID=464258 RepID=A0A7S2Z3D3_9CHLO|mmetsp:Transcript_2426/g.5654  ORF Transcript_2426/g.5654 Transcript_2426/m.5654 type:complete len:115 (+) Transcript_2426:138-482(+)